MVFAWPRRTCWFIFQHSHFSCLFPILLLFLFSHQCSLIFFFFSFLFWNEISWYSLLLYIGGLISQEVHFFVMPFVRKQGCTKSINTMLLLPLLKFAKSCIFFAQQSTLQLLSIFNMERWPEETTAPSMQCSVSTSAGSYLAFPISSRTSLFCTYLITISLSSELWQIQLLYF